MTRSACAHVFAGWEGLHLGGRLQGRAVSAAGCHEHVAAEHLRHVHSAAVFWIEALACLAAPGGFSQQDTLISFSRVASFTKVV